MIHRHGRYFLIPYFKNIKKFADQFIHVLLKIIIYNFLVMRRIIAFISRPEKEIETLKERRVAC
jgi:hypothetical protein